MGIGRKLIELMDVCGRVSFMSEEGEAAGESHKRGRWRGSW